MVDSIFYEKKHRIEYICWVWSKILADARSLMQVKQKRLQQQKESKHTRAHTHSTSVIK